MLAEAEKNLKTKRDKKSSEGEFLFHWARHQARAIGFTFWATKI